TPVLSCSGGVKAVSTSDNWTLFKAATLLASVLLSKDLPGRLPRPQSTITRTKAAAPATKLSMGIDSPGSDGAGWAWQRP
ncbi:MAG: hypothetical protein AB8E74_10185, partial [Prochlorococcus sp.]